MTIAIASACLVAFLAVVALGVRWIVRMVRRAAYEELREQIEDQFVETAE